MEGPHGVREDIGREKRQGGWTGGSCGDRSQRSKRGQTQVAGRCSLLRCNLVSSSFPSEITFSY